MGAGGSGWARVPLAGAVLGCFGGILCAEWGWSVWWAGLLVWPMLLAGRAGRWGAVLGGLALISLWVLHGSRLAEQDALRRLLGEREEVELGLVVTEVREGGRFHPEAVAVVEDGPAGTHGARVGLRGVQAPLLPGDRLRVTGRGIALMPVRNPGELDRMAWMNRAGMAGELRVSSQERSGPPAKWLRRLAWRARGQIKDRIVAGLDEDGVSAALIRALVLGERSADQVELFAAFRRSGTMHVFAVSGLHVGMVGLLAWGLLRLLRVPRLWGLWLVLAVMWAYALVTGLRPPAMRASLMASIFLLGYVVRRDPSLANALLASVLPVLWLDSFQWRQPGFQLSYLVVAAIIMVGPLLFRRVKPWVEGDPFLPRSLYTRRQTVLRRGREKVAGLAVVSASAWTGSMPLMAMHFDIVTPSAIVASMVLVPVVFLMLAVAIIGLLLGLVWEPLEVGVNRANRVLAHTAHSVARGFAAMPGSFIELPGDPWWGNGLVVFDLWDGDGAVFFDHGGGVLIDAGGRDEYGRVVFPALRDGGAGARSLVLTHADGGHCGGMARAVEGWGARQALLPVAEARSPYFREFVATAGREECQLVVAERGRRYRIDDEAEIEVLWVPDAGGIADDQCQILRLHWAGWRILLTGDAGFETEKRLLEQGVDVSADLWITGRHRSDFTGTLEFVRAVGPKAVVAGHARFPAAERVPAWWAEMLAQEGIDLWNQGQAGAVAIEVAGDAIVLKSYADQARRARFRRP